MLKPIEKYIIYSHKEKAYIKWFDYYFNGGCGFTNVIEKAEQFNSYEEVLNEIQYYEVDYCEIIKIYVLEENGEENI